MQDARESDELAGKEGLVGGVIGHRDAEAVGGTAVNVMLATLLSAR